MKMRYTDGTLWHKGKNCAEDGFLGFTVEVFLGVFLGWPLGENLLGDLLGWGLVGGGGRGG